MKRYNKFISIHIMKTAGTTIGKELERKYGNKMLWDRTYRNDKTELGIINLTDKSESIYPKNYKEFNVIHGHFSTKKYAHLNLPMITFIRNPIERVISHYSYMMDRKLDHEIHDCISLKKFCKLTENTITKLIGDDLNNFIFIGITDKFEESLSRLGRLINFKFMNNRTENKTKNKIEMSKEQIQIIRSYNEADIKLYKKIFKRFTNGIW